MATNEEIIKEIGIAKKKITGNDILKIIKEDGADSLADDLTSMRDNIINFLMPALEEARQDERNKVLSFLMNKGHFEEIGNNPKRYFLLPKEVFDTLIAYKDAPNENIKGV
jgi:hypothetical protein